MRYFDSTDPKAAPLAKKRPKIPDFNEMLADTSRHPRFMRMPMFKVDQGDGRFMLTNTMNPEK